MTDTKSLLCKYMDPQSLVCAVWVEWVLKAEVVVLSGLYHMHCHGVGSRIC